MVDLSEDELFRVERNIVWQCEQVLEVDGWILTWFVSASNIAPAMKCRERSKPVGRGLRPRRNVKPTNLRCKIVADRPECDPYQTVSCHNISSPHL